MAIAAFERSGAVNKFNARFDQFVVEYGWDVSMFGVEIAGQNDPDFFRVYVGSPAGFTSNYLTPQELEGLALFNADSATQLGVNLTPAPRNGGMCYLCHVTSNYDTNDYSTTGGGHLSKVAPGIYPPLFTNFSYDNLGIPVNATARALSGLSMLPYYQDLGLGAQTAIMALRMGVSMKMMALMMVNPKFPLYVVLPNRRHTGIMFFSRR